jgi:hypothetical protein
MTPKSFWSYQAPEPPPPPANIIREDWEKLSPGYRREIVRQQKREAVRRNSHTGKS